MSHTAEARGDSPQRRDQVAQRRDEAAVERHLEADVRDVEATRRDDLVDAPGSYTGLLALHLELRRSAAADRQLASADRHADAEDRGAAGQDRLRALGDRQASTQDCDHAALDPLTGVYNRTAGFNELLRDLDRTRRTKSSFTLAFVDIDDLKGINDTHGHAAGDRALQRVVHELRMTFRAHDVIVRFGGDEFLCAIASMADEELSIRLQRVSDALARPPEPVAVTVGLATLQPQASGDNLVRRAGAASANRNRR